MSHPLEPIAWRLAELLGVSLREAAAVARDRAGLDPNRPRSPEDMQAYEAAFRALIEEKEGMR